jgi:nickel-dependent lactate racemase
MAANREIVLSYGDGTQSAQLDWDTPLGTIDVASVTPLADPVAKLLTVLDDPIGLNVPVLSAVKPDDHITITVSDAFRKTAIDLLLPTLIDSLTAKGVREDTIRFLFATGTHRAPNAEEQRRILGTEAYGRFEGRLFVHDPHDSANLVYLGQTKRGTPVWINRLAVECDRLIVTGACVLHYFGGFGGGRKGIVPGVAGVETISHNHALNLDPIEDRLNPEVRIGVLDGNPVSEDMVEAATMVSVTGLINTVLTPNGEIADVFVGDLDAAHRAAADYAYSLYARPIDRQADLVIASAGDRRNFVQSHKALYNAWQAMRPGGRIILLARCEEGIGGHRFAEWLAKGSREAVISGLRETSEINGQTALSTLEKAQQAFLVSDLSEQDLALVGGQSGPNLQSALGLAHETLVAEGCSNPTTWLMPNAAYTVPFLSVDGS